MKLHSTMLVTLTCQRARPDSFIHSTLLVVFLNVYSEGGDPAPVFNHQNFEL